MSRPHLTAESPWPHIERGVGHLHSWSVSAGERIVVLQGGHLPSFGLVAAACLEGVTAIPLPPDMGPQELVSTISDASPSLVVVDPARARSREVLRELDGVRVVETGHDDLVSGRPRSPRSRWPSTRPMTYTSGTTGRRKGVFVGIHDAAWGRWMVEDELAAYAGRQGDCNLVIAPLYHSGPFRFAFMSAMTGGTVAVLPKFSGEAFQSALRTVRPSNVTSVPTHLHRLLASPGMDADALSSLSLLVHGGAPTPESLKRRLLELAPEGSVWEMYGATEGQFTTCPPDVWEAAPGTSGVARPGRSISVRDSAGREVEVGEVGSVWVNSPPEARFEYWRDAESTARAWSGDAFTCGDLGHVDRAGRLFLDGRPGDLVITGGVNVYPAEVERALLQVEGVMEAVAFGVPDQDWGERLVGAVIVTADCALTPERLRVHLRHQLSGAQVPKQLYVVDQLPRTPLGKVKRHGIAAALGIS